MLRVKLAFNLYIILKYRKNTKKKVYHLVHIVTQFVDQPNL